MRTYNNIIFILYTVCSIKQTKEMPDEPYNTLVPFPLNVFIRPYNNNNQTNGLKLEVII